MEITDSLKLLDRHYTCLVAVRLSDNSQSCKRASVMRLFTTQPPVNYTAWKQPERNLRKNFP